MIHKGLSIKYVRKVFRKTNISNPLIRTRTYAYQWVEMLVFRKILRAYLMDEPQKQRKRYAEKKQMIAELAKKSPTNAAKLRKFMNKSPGRQPLENLYPDLHQAIIDLVIVGSGADSRRRNDVLNSCKTIDDLRAALRKEDYVLSRQVLYLRLILRRADSQEGKRYVRTVSVKITQSKKCSA